MRQLQFGEDAASPVWTMSPLGCIKFRCDALQDFHREVEKVDTKKGN